MGSKNLTVERKIPPTGMFGAFCDPMEDYECVGYSRLLEKQRGEKKRTENKGGG